MFLSVVIPMFNGEKYIADCIESIIKQGLSSKDYEMIVIDDGSNDNGPNIVRELMTQFENLYLFQQINTGLGSSRNIGVKYAKGDWIHFVDCDDRIKPESYKILYSTLINRQLNNESTDVLSFKSVTIWNDCIIHPVYSSDDIIFKGYLYDYVERFGFRSPAWGYWLRRNFLIDNNLKFKNCYAEDICFNLDLFHKYDGIICMVDTIVYYYIRRNNSITTNNSIIKLEQGIRDLANIYSQVSDLMTYSRYNSRKFFSVIRCLSQPALTRMLTAPFSLKKRRELIEFCKEKELFPLKYLINPQYEKFGNFLVKYPWLMTPVGFLYRNLFIPYLKRFVDIYTGRFVFRVKKIAI